MNKDKNADAETDAETDVQTIQQLVDFFSSIERDQSCQSCQSCQRKPGKVVHETECHLTRRPELDVHCHCFRHNVYVVHGKWFFEK